ncbi:zinc ribbon domain-containing protein [Natrinema zhouii]|uniref:Zinc ribbon domain-containing protein n=1 Tax=Natrinema zhouii TaxID=1710539 RepID=A0A7D6GQY0_9EURY|nr:zinc ribbon domain-containing protein [Natrinema zhouii]QLK26122.1 zinc ribbon domain-containing protein [Natrinema zhouii]
MDEPGPYALLGRLGVAIFVMIAPTLCFLGLVRGLERLRDDDLINEWARTRGSDVHDITEHDDVLAVLANEMGVEADRSSTVRCPACGTLNRSGMTYCHGCQHRLKSS